MIPDDRLQPTLQKLLDRSRQGVIPWVTGINDEYFWSYQVDIDGNRIVLSRPKSVSAPDKINLSIRDPAGKEVHDGSVYLGDEQFELYADLFAEADRRATGWDKVLGRIERSLEGDRAVTAG